ncbi:MAG: Na+/H+ antiporter subunit D [candidate division KSB1 bacterium]|jgi:multicomponent Na+:H+ antiporter subunit D|nr:Na+/H+ antiporter subunit D [candidate division KSB1 bacterium]
MKMLLVLPVLIPFFTAILLLFTLRWRYTQYFISTLGSVSLLVSSIQLLLYVRHEGIQVIQIGNWVAPFGISLVGDLLSVIMVLLTAIVGLAVNIYSIMAIDLKRQAYGYFPLFNLLLMGVCGAFMTGDIFNLYVWFEVMLMSSFVLMILGGERAQMEGAVNYVTINLIASALFLTGLGILYGQTGTLNMADLAYKLRVDNQGELIASSAMLFLIAFGIKAAVFPLFFWLPASYHTPPAAVSALFAGLLTKVGVYALLRSFTLFFVHDAEFMHMLILIIAALTMITGVLGAASQFEFRRILSFHIISQIGYMIMGLGIFTPLAIAGSVFYIIHHIIVKTNLFLVSGIVHRLKGSYDLKKLGGVYKSHPFLSLLFVIPAFSLAGIPPLSGFWAKFILIKAGLDMQNYWIVVVALIVSILTLYSMTKIWNEVFWKKAPDSKNTIPVPRKRALAIYICPVCVLALLTVIIGLAVEPVFVLAQQTAEQLLNPTQYIIAVLGASQ